MNEKIQQFFSHTSVAVGAPLTGGSVGIISFFENMVPILTILSLLLGMALGIMSYCLKRKLILKQLKDNKEITAP